MEFISFDLAKKLKEKGFACELPFAMYNELGQFALLTTSAPIRKAESGYTYRDYYDYEGFDENDFIAPTIGQVMKWFRNKKAIQINITLWSEGWYYEVWVYEYYEDEKEHSCNMIRQSNDYSSYEAAALEGIKYVLNNLI